MHTMQAYTLTFTSAAALLKFKILAIVKSVPPIPIPMLHLEHVASHMGRSITMLLLPQGAFTHAVLLLHTCSVLGVRPFLLFGAQVT